MSIRFLSSADFGRFTLGKTIFQSFDYSHLGMRYSLDRLLPNVNSEEEKAEYFVVARRAIAISSLLLFILWLFYCFNDVKFYFIFLLTGTLYSIMMIYRVYYRAENNKLNFLTLNVIVNLLPLILQVLGIFFWRMNGYLLFSLIGHLIAIGLIKYLFEVRSRIEFRKAIYIIKKLFRNGLILFLSAMFSFMSSIGDRFIIEEYWGLAIFGEYSVILFSFSVFSIFSVSYTEMIMNTIVKSRSFSFVIKQSFIIVIMNILLVFISYLVLPFLVDIFMPAYKIHLSLMKSSLIGAIPFSCLPILNHFLHAIDKRHILLYVNIFCTLIYFFVLLHILKNEVCLVNLIYAKNLFYFLLLTMTVLFSLIIVKRDNIW